MARDLYQSNRTSFLRCEWFKQDERAIRDNPSSFSVEKKPCGVFYARYANAYTTGQNQVAGVFMFAQNTITIQTTDNVQGIKAGDLVRMDGADWQVLEVQFREEGRRAQHRRPGGTSPSGKTYIQMRK